MTCRTCRYLTVTRREEEHIILRHFLSEDGINDDHWQSYFFANLISPQEVIREVLNTPRYQLGQSRWSHGRFIYNFTFGFDVGVYYNQRRPGTICTTNTVQIVCACVQCPGCGVHPPTQIITMFLGPDP